MSVRRADWTDAEEQCFWANVDQRGDGCWPWTKGMSEGYGTARHRNESYPAHRLAYLFHHRIHEISSSVHICHHCDNPPCC